MRSILLTACSVSLFSLPAFAQSPNAVLAATHDAAIASYNPNGTVATGGMINNEHLNIERESNGSEAQALVHFNLTSLVLSEPIVKAQLWFGNDSVVSSGGVDINVYAANSGFDWTSTAPTWNTTGGGLDTELGGLVAAGGSYSMSWWDGLSAAIPDNVYFELNPALIQAFVDDPSTFNGFALVRDSGSVTDSYQALISMEHGTSVPTLLIWTAAPVPEVSSALLASLGILPLLRRRR